MVVKSSKKGSDEENLAEKCLGESLAPYIAGETFKKWAMTKKVHQNFLWIENIFLGELKNFFLQSLRISSEI